MKLGLGTVQFGQAYGISAKHGQVPPQEVREILARGAEAGIRILDTAANYGTAEAVLAEMDTSPFRIVTKTTHLHKGLDVVIERARLSARVLPRADTLLVHMADDLEGPEGEQFWKELLRLRGDGIFRKIGISAYASQNPASLAARFRPDTMQLPFSLLDQRLLHDGTLERIKELDVEIHARSIFLQGLLFLDSLPERLRYAAPQLDKVRARITEAGSNPLAAALAFVQSRPEIDTALVGVAELAQMQEILVAAAEPPPPLNWADCALQDELVLTPSRW